MFIRRTDAEAESPIIWPPDMKNWLIGQDPDTGKIEGRRIRGWWRMRWLDSITDLMDMSLSKFQELLMGKEAWHALVHEVTKIQTQLSNWIELNWCQPMIVLLSRCAYMFWKRKYALSLLTKAVKISLFSKIWIRLSIKWWWSLIPEWPLFNIILQTAIKMPPNKAAVDEHTYIQLLYS